MVMVENTIDEKLEKKYSDLLENISEKKIDEKKCYRAVELFFSFDIVNSSLYKDVNCSRWEIVLTTLLTDIQKKITKVIPEAQLWRALGDEIIFFVTIRNIEEIYSTIDSIYRVLSISNVKIKDGSFFEKIDAEVNIINNSNILAVQSAAWIAIILHGENKLINKYDNIFKKYIIDDNQQINEFLGQDIDTGFRIKKETQDRRLILSLELAKILSDKTEYLSRLNIITYKSLKGVWKNRLYPIIWYHDSSVSGISFEDSFYYDETTYSQLSKEYFLNRENIDGDLALYMFTDVHRALSKVIKDQNLEGKIDYISKVIDETENDVKIVESEFDNKLLELHCAVVCCDVTNKRVLIVKRSNRKYYPQLWEFGCSKASIDKDIVKSVKEDYKDDFGIDIEIVCDKNREDKEPLPIALYQVEKDGKIHKGIILVAKIVGNTEMLPRKINSSKKHENFKWICEDEVDIVKSNDAISDFGNTLNKVFSGWNEYFG